MSIRQLYQHTIKQHCQTAYGRDVQFAYSYKVTGSNPSCGDELEMWLVLSTGALEETISRIGYHIDACAICTASTSLLSQYCEGKTLAQIKKDAEQFEQALKNARLPTIESLQCLAPVSAHPSRINCALLPWNTLRKVAKSCVNDKDNLNSKANSCDDGITKTEVNSNA